MWDAWGALGMRIIIAGSRGFGDYEALLRAISASDFAITEVVSGGARGVDTLGERWATEQDVKLTLFPANWGKFGKAAGMYRNAEMASYADGLIALWDGESRGTLDMIDKMRRQRKPREVWMDGRLL